MTADPNCVDGRVREVMNAGGNPFNELAAAKRENPMAYVTPPIYVAALAALWDKAAKTEEKLDDVCETNNLWDGR